ncbi:unnamed protein product [marine sediment metagenome]|uniref:Uncharacterized protein n=1 Tax=marine sediment metagenome TaxID=412755 RepID=X0TBG3_9ZZZZ
MKPRNQLNGIKILADDHKYLRQQSQKTGKSIFWIVKEAIQALKEQKKNDS